MKTINQLALLALTISGMAFGTAHAETGVYGRSKMYDIGSVQTDNTIEPAAGPSSKPMNCMDMPCCKDMKNMDCSKMSEKCEDMKMDAETCMKMMEQAKPETHQQHHQK